MNLMLHPKHKYIANVLLKSGLMQKYFVYFVRSSKYCLIMKSMWHNMTIFYFDVLHVGTVPNFFITSISFTQYSHL